MSYRGTPSKEISSGQLATVMSRLAIALPSAIAHSNLDIKDVLKASGQGVKLSRALGEAFKMVCSGDAKVTAPNEPHILSIDRTKQKITLGFYEDRKILDLDERSLKLTEIDLTKVKLIDVMKEDERTITGKERMRRIKETGHIRLDSWILQAILKNPDCIPASWDQKRYITFDGTIFEFEGYGTKDSPKQPMVTWLYKGDEGWKYHDSSFIDRDGFHFCFLAAVLPV